MAGNQGGRKSYWESRIEPRLKEIAAWARDGYTDKQMYEALGMSHETFFKYKRIKPELADALKVNKAIADLHVENSLYKKANGFTYDEVTIEEKTDALGNVIETKKKKVVKTVAPDTTAQIFWLKNRQPEKWRDKRVTELSGNVELEGISPEKYLAEKGIPIPEADDIEDVTEE